MSSKTAILLSIALLASGCASRVPPVATTRPTPTIASSDFERLWAACDAVARELHFDVDRDDRRSGVLATAPMTGAQPFEPWRRELRTAAAAAESALANVRRTLRFDVVRQPDGTFVATPSVRVQRYALAERRLTSSASFTSAFRPTKTYGTPESDATGVALPRSYWYDVGTDPALEAHVAAKVERRLR